MVNERTHWEELKNIQVFTGLGNFFFAFKELQPDLDLDKTFIKLLTPHKITRLTFDPDIILKKYKNHMNHGILNYNSMPQNFYLRKIFFYCKTEDSILKEEERTEEDVLNEFLQKGIEKTKFCVDLITVLKKKLENQARNFTNEWDILSRGDMLLLIKFDEIYQKKSDKIFLQVYTQILEEKQMEQEREVFTDLEILSIEDLEFMELCYSTQTFDNGKGKTIFYS